MKQIDKQILVYSVSSNWQVSSIVVNIKEQEDLIKQRKDENIKKINFILVTLIVIFNINLFTESFFK